MSTEKRDTRQSQIDKHSLPGMNQAGEGPEERDKDDQNPLHSRRDQSQAAIEEHSLPGMNQAGEGPGDDQP
jgi:hypothetical protein